MTNISVSEINITMCFNELKEEKNGNKNNLKEHANVVVEYIRNTNI